MTYDIYIYTSTWYRTAAVTLIVDTITAPAIAGGGVTPPVTPPTPPAATCPTGWASAPTGAANAATEYCFLPVQNVAQRTYGANSGKSWSECKDTCDNMQASMLCINNAAEQVPTIYMHFALCTLYFVLCTLYFVLPLLTTPSSQTPLSYALYTIHYILHTINYTL
jgi:hypothetical protein